MARNGLEVGFLLDARWHLLRGEMDRTKRPALMALAQILDAAGLPPRVIGRLDLLHEKLRAGTDPARRRSKRLQDLADAQAILEEAPELRTHLSAQERTILDALPG
ncbi:MAG: hypothetical protein IT306_20130 [Chloroflexi bacterium]|nr:hypothetical protein [Chloroflexota bacterium]